MFGWGISQVAQGEMVVFNSSAHLALRSRVTLWVTLGLGNGILLLLVHFLLTSYSRLFADITCVTFLFYAQEATTFGAAHRTLALIHRCSWCH